MYGKYNRTAPLPSSDCRSVGHSEPQGRGLRNIHSTFLVRAARALERRWLPATCLVCRSDATGTLDLCDSCVACFPRIEWASGADNTACLGCGAVSAARHLRCDGAGRPWCLACRQRAPLFRRTVAPWRYAYPIDGMIGALKQQRQRAIGRSLGLLLAEELRRVAATDALQPLLPDLVMAVPDHPARRAERQFSPAEDIASTVAGALAVEHASGAAIRVGDAGSLARRSRAERALAIRGAFRVDDSVFRRHVAVVDDVLTTGATSGELARECLDAGAASVELWVLARTALDA